MLKAVLANAPTDWEDAHYDRNTYRLFELKELDGEFINEKIPFDQNEPRLVIEKMQRVQNPFQYGRFLIRKEQLEYRDEFRKVVKYYHPVDKRDLNTSLEFNMDVRRYSYRSGCTSDNKNPLLYKTPGAANAACTASEKAILVCNVLGRDYEGSTTYKSNDTEYMPIYVVTLI